MPFRCDQRPAGIAHDVMNGPDHPIPFVEIDALEVLAFHRAGGTGVVDQNVEMTERHLDFGEHCAHLCLVGHIALQQ